MLAFPLSRHAHDLDFISDLQGRGHAASETAGGKGNLQSPLKRGIPSSGWCFRTIRVHHDLQVDALFPFIVFGWAMQLPPALVENDLL
jgi:hypothetical protein